MSDTKRQMTDDEMLAAENAAASDLQAWVNAFIKFPTQANRMGVVDRMMAYQPAWMHGRQRP